MKKLTLLVLAALMLGGTGEARNRKQPADEQPQTYGYQWCSNTFVGISGGWGLRLSHEDISTYSDGTRGQGGYRLSWFAGKWINPYLALQLSGTATRNQHYDKTFQIWSGEVLLDPAALRRGWRPGRTFRVLPLAGIGMACVTETGLKPFVFTLGAQARLALNRHFDLFGEVKGHITNDGTIFKMENPAGSLLMGFNAGISYTICPRSFSRRTPATGYAAEIERLNGQINEMRETLAEIKDRMNAAPADTVTAGTHRAGSSLLHLTSILQNGMYIGVNFPKYSAYLSESEKQSISKVAEWMKQESNYKICIAAFGDGMNDADFEQNLKFHRTNAIFNELTKRYRVKQERIQIINPTDEEKDLVSEYGALIFFLPDGHTAK